MAHDTAFVNENIRIPNKISLERIPMRGIDESQRWFR